jgi:molecular chaperone GrpE
MCSISSGTKPKNQCRACRDSQKMSKDTNNTPEQKEMAEAKSAKPNAGEDESQEAASEQLQADLERFRDLAMRSQADFENYRKRAAREKEEGIRYANASFLERMIPILDSFELGLAAARSSEGTAQIVAGMEMVYKQLRDFLAECGVQAIDAPEGEFDPKIHEALAQEHSDSVEEGRIVRQMRRGYRLKDRLLRAANVIVSKGPAK